MEDFSQSLVAVSTFSSNILFWRESNYFESAAELKPLLHTWSLAVEEQYYVIFPLAMMAIWRFGKRVVVVFFFLVFVASLSLAQWGTYNAQSAAFYLLPTRGWELILGALSAVYLWNRNDSPEVMSANVMSACGLLMILGSIFAYSESTPFPGLYALVPTLGTVLIILFANERTLVFRILSTRIAVGIGLISYSAYLWHQPLFAFARHANTEETSVIIMLFLAVISLLLAYFSWKFVETPFRKGKFTRVRLFSVSGIIMFFFCIVGFSGHFTAGFEKQIVDLRYDSQNKKLYEFLKSHTKYDVYENISSNEECILWTPDARRITNKKLKYCFDRYGKSLVIVGDSHAINLFNILAKTKISPYIIGVSKGGCRPGDLKEKCHYEDFVEFLKQNKETVGTVIYHQAGSYFIADIFGEVDS